MLLLDEPTAGMSATETHETIQLLERIAAERGLTLLFTEHDMEVVFSIAQKIAVLHQGRVIAEGRPEDVRGDPEVRRVYLGHGLVRTQHDNEAAARDRGRCTPPTASAGCCSAFRCRWTPANVSACWVATASARRRRCGR